jgi:NifU-like protein involved in Fe-S cluster formation
MAMTPDEDSIFAVYNERLVALAARAEAPSRLENPDARVRAVSPICGSEIEVDIELKNGKISGFGFAVQACALTKSVVAVMRSAMIGKSRPEIQTASAELAAMLEGKGTYPSGDWAELRLLEPVKDYKARHNSILLPFEAVEMAFEQIKERQGTR